ncbi:DUF393 domain-containing protein [Pontiellaceae bacterium B1224]|nr:DUF393 domain-containing protein [Pontiellaceae bacterium B1224]
MAPTDKMLILYDGNCPICCAKRDFLQRKDRQNNLSFSDIRSPDFQRLEIPVAIELLEREIHSIRPDGRVLRGMEVIRAAYEEIGLGWLAKPTGWPLLRPLFDRLYAFIARNRSFISKISIRRNR